MSFTVASTYKLDRNIMQDLNVLSSTARHDLGYAVRSTDGRKYVYTFLSTATTAAPGASYPAYYLQAKNADLVTTTTRPSDLTQSFAGVFCSALAAGSNYAWVQTAGIVASGYVSTNVAAGEALTTYATGMVDAFHAVAGAVTSSTNVSLVTYELIAAKGIGIALQAVSSGKADWVISEQ